MLFRLPRAPVFRVAAKAGLVSAGPILAKQQKIKHRIRSGADGFNERVVTADPRSQQLMPAPQSAQYQEDYANSVTLAGVVVSDPVRAQNSSKDIVNLMLAVPRYIKKKEDPGFQTFRMAFFDFCGNQAAAYALKGRKILVQGRLSSYKGTASVVVDNFALIEEDSWPYPDPEAPDQPNTTDQESQTIVRSYLSASTLRVYEDYTNGEQIEVIARKRNLKPATVLTYLAECAFHDRHVDFEFLAKSCLLGPRGNQYMETDAVYAAIKTVIEGEQLVDLSEVPVKEVVSLIRSERGGKPFKVQEQLIRSVTYSQVAVVLAMMKQGLTSRDWNSFKVGMPLPASREYVSNSPSPPF